MIECTRCVKNRCVRIPSLPPPICPPPTRIPFPWRYVLPWILFFGTMGAVYRYYLWMKDNEKNNESKPVWRPRLKNRRPFYATDLPTCVQYLIIGGGTAAWSAYNSIMENHPTAKVFFITIEDCLPYERPPLTKHMWWNKEPPNIDNLNYVDDGVLKTMYYTTCKNFIDPIKFYRKEIGPAASIAQGWRVLRVDPEEHAVYIETLCGEQPIFYERCLIATGSRPKNLNVFKTASKGVKEKITTLSTIRDLEIAFRKARAAKHVTIIGGGNLGSELAWSLGKMNQKTKENNPLAETPEVVHVIKDKGILPGILPEYLGEWAVEKIKVEGAKVITKNEVVDAFKTEDDRLNLTLSDGSSLITDYVFVAVGSEARTEIGEKSNLEIDEVNGGMIVNTELEARKHLFVAGDAASVYTEWKDTRMRFQHYANALETGEIAGANMAGAWVAANLEPHFWFTLGEDLNVEVIGEAGACLQTVGIFKQCADDPAPAPKLVNIEASGDKPCYKKTPEYKNRYKRGMIFYLRDEFVVGVTFWNIPPVDDRTGAVIEMLRARPTYKDINMLAELLGFPQTQCTYAKQIEELEEPDCFTKFKEF